MNKTQKIMYPHSGGNYKGKRTCGYTIYFDFWIEWKVEKGEKTDVTLNLLTQTAGKTEGEKYRLVSCDKEPFLGFKTLEQISSMSMVRHREIL